MSSSTAAAPATKRQGASKDVPYHLIYWPGVPGRGEFVRLALEEAGVAYDDTAHSKHGISEVLALIDAKKSRGDALNPPPCAPPILRHGDLVIWQTPNILQYIGVRTGLAGPADDEDAVYRVAGLTLTALDGLCTEVHDCHHPIATGLYYEDQKEESLRRSTDYVRNRLPKFLGYFERVLAGEASGEGPWLYGGVLTYSDLTLFHCLDGVTFAFPKAMAQLKESGKYAGVFALYDAVRERPRIKAYLASDRRQRYGNGIYRHYDELDVV